MNDVEKIKHLSIDSSFGILTRPALELVLFEDMITANIYVIDFSGIHKLNKEIGYETVNQMIKQSIITLTNKFTKLIIGRVFSGDEIAIIDTNFNKYLMSDYADICICNNLGFKWVEFTDYWGNTIEENKRILDELSQKLQKNKFSKILW